MGHTPIEKLSALLLKDTLEIWNNIPKPKDNKDAGFEDYFVLDVVGLSHYVHEKDRFMKEVAELRNRFSFPSEKPLVPSIDFVKSTSEIWDKVVNDKVLDIPSHQVMIAKIRCEQIDNDKFNGFISNQEWSQLKAAVNNPPIPKFGLKVTSLIDKYLSEYDVETEFYDEFVKAEQKRKLEQRLLQEIKPILGSLMDNLSSKVLKDFKLKLDKDLNEGKKFREAADWSWMLMNFDVEYEDLRIQQAEWTSTKVKYKLETQIIDHVNSIKSMKQNEFTKQIKSKLKRGLTESMGAILKSPESNMWDNLSDLFRHETGLACSEFRVALEDFGTDETIKLEALETLMDYGKDIIVKSVRKETYKILQIMHDKFCHIFLIEPDSSIPRIWKGSDDIHDIVKTARADCVNVMSTAMAIIRLENKEKDCIQEILYNALLERGGEGILTSNNWDGVEASRTLISPAACATIWDKFLKSSGIIITIVKQTIQASIGADKTGLVVPDNEPSIWEKVWERFLLNLPPPYLYDF